jgi:hypothetical protein
LQEKRLKQRARGYAVVNGELYKSGVTEPWLKCITSEKGLELLREIHSGFCGAHIGTRALAGKAIKQGFYWPTINIDAKALVRQCEACQKTANQQNLPSMPVHLIPLLTVKIRQPSHEFTFGVGISFIPYPLVLTPVV